MTDWNPDLYYRYREARSRPFRDLVELLPPDLGGDWLDLGCGDGTLTRQAAVELGAESVLGVDCSSSMVEKARSVNDSGDGVAYRWAEQDLVDAIDTDETFQLVLSNAALHWVDHHARVVPKMLQRVAPGGWIAVQMPFNHVARTHLLMKSAAQMCDGASDHVGLVRRWPQERPRMYADMLDEAGFDFVLVQLRTYRHAMRSLDELVEFLRGAGLRPWLDAIPESHHEAFLDTYAKLLDHAYPATDDGGTRLVDYSRLLIVGRRPEPYDDE